MKRIACTSVLLSIACVGSLFAQQTPSFFRDVKPLLAHYCEECHNPARLKGGLDLQSFKGLMSGSKKGPVIEPAKPDDSRLILLAEGKEKPAMPPEKFPRLKPDELKIIRAWIAAGATDDTGTQVVTLPEIKPRTLLATPITALAYRPSVRHGGSATTRPMLLSAPIYHGLALIDPVNGEIVGRIGGLTDRITALAFSPDGLTLAVASGSAGRSGEIRFYAIAPANPPAPKLIHTIAAHKDLIQDLAFSPDGKTLASCGYDRLVKLWDTGSAQELKTLKDHSDSVYGVAFNSDGTLLASVAADRAVKVWDVDSGTRLFTLGEATDWVYAVAWSHQGNHLAAAGVDRSIRVWEATKAGGKIVHSVFAHGGAVLRLAYSEDDSTLYSIGEDGVSKAWDSQKMAERRVYDKQPSPITLAVSPDRKQIAVGRFDGTLVLIDESSGKVQSQPLPATPKLPQLSKMTPSAGIRGRSVRVVFEGKELDETVELLSPTPGITGKIVGKANLPDQVEFELTLEPALAAATHRISLKTSAGKTAALGFTVDLFRTVPASKPHDSPRTAQKVALPVSITGVLAEAGDVGFFRFEAGEGEQIGVQAVTAAIGSKLEPVLTLLDSAGTLLAESSTGLLGYTCTAAGTYALGIRDRDFRGGPDMSYRLHVGPLPVVTSVFPLGIQRGTEAEISVRGVNLGNSKSVHVKAPSDTAPGTTLPVIVATPSGAPLGSPTVVVGEFPEAAHDPSKVLTVPITCNGILRLEKSADVWRFEAKKGQRLVVEVNARRLGSPLDSYIEILDSRGQPVPRAVLRCLARTYTVFRDHDSASAGIRIEAWTELAMNDYIWADGELLKIDELPKNPDDDCRFVSFAGQRLGFLDTTPTSHSNGTPMYKVAIHPPGTSFPPNGLPVITLFYRNDDGGPGYGKDSRLFFDPPADGEYQVRIRDTRGQGSSIHAYRLTIRPPRPGYTVRFSPSAPAVWKGGAVPMTVTAERLDGFDGPIELQLQNLPPGFHAPATLIGPAETSTAFALFADAGAPVPGKDALKLVAKAQIDGKDEIREAAGTAPTLLDPGDIVTTTEQSEVAIQPGKETRLTVHIERRNGFTGRVPVEVRGLPHGVRVLDIGLNGILVTEGETARTFVIYAEPWVLPTERPFVVLAKREGKNTDHAARSVLLRIRK
jgi:WD40 repeat protein